MARRKRKRVQRPYLEWQRWYAVAHLPDSDTEYKVLRVKDPADAQYYYAQGRLYPTLQKAEERQRALNLSRVSILPIFMT